MARIELRRCLQPFAMTENRAGEALSLREGDRRVPSHAAALWTGHLCLVFCLTLFSATVGFRVDIPTAPSAASVGQMRDGHIPVCKA